MVDFPQPQMLAVNGIELEVFSAGSGKPIVLCHGWPEHAFSWRHQIKPLVDAGYHVIVPNQRGYGQSTKPSAITDYDIEHLTADLIAILDHYGYEDACFVGHDWGAIIVWNLAMMYRERVSHVINLSVPFMERGASEWIGFWEAMLGPDFYMVHFNRQPGVADEVFDNNSKQFLNNLYRTNQWRHPNPDLGQGMPLINLAQDPAWAAGVPGDPIMSDAEMQVFLDAFATSGFTGGINWYRNLSLNWEIMGAYEQHIYQPTLAIFGDYDSVPKSKNLANRVSDLEVAEFPCGHWIQQEMPEETNAAMLDWLTRHYSS